MPWRKETRELHSTSKMTGRFGPGEGWFGSGEGWFGSGEGWFGIHHVPNQTCQTGLNWDSPCSKSALSSLWQGWFGSGVGWFEIPHVPNQPCQWLWSGLILDSPCSKSATYSSCWVKCQALLFSSVKRRQIYMYNLPLLTELNSSAQHSTQQLEYVCIVFPAELPGSCWWMIVGDQFPWNLYPLTHAFCRCSLWIIEIFNFGSKLGLFSFVKRNTSTCVHVNS